MEVDPTFRLSPSGFLKSVSRPTYTQVVASMSAIDQPPAPVQRQAGIEGALRDESLSSGRLLEQSTKCTEAALVIQLRSRPTRLV